MVENYTLFESKFVVFWMHVWRNFSRNSTLLDTIFFATQVGAAVSMVYSTGQPVIFVGVGQTYADLKKLNVSNIVKLLLR